MTRPPRGGRPSGRRGGAGKGPGGRSDGGRGGGGGKIRFVKDVACPMAIPRVAARVVLVVAQLLSIEWQIRSAR